MDARVILDVIVLGAGLVCVLGGFAVLWGCGAASLSWRALSGLGVSLAGAVGVWDAADGVVDVKTAIMMIGLAIPLANVLWRVWHHMPVRRITDLAMFDEKPHHHHGA
jgi:hypothetical protein